MAIDLQVARPYALNLWRQLGITLRSGGQQRWLALARGVASVARRGDIQYVADQLDPEVLALHVDEAPHFLMWRSSSALAKTRWPA
ncbi:hypothetical protein [Pelomonas sp. Root1444]|uniref:hypothetical protein n=1 Tax=Pelomonas sp. Root1444 TaxID=1736464 RepID=UPI0007030214|nr:hypothetical protein [Pelomonas sp. Root1444]KQY86424.1 hypothetical protein ASD35_19740 [Pelomonas sp. Root1444]